MPGRGPAPKDASQRRRTNTPTRGEWTEVRAPAKPVIPTLAKAAPAPSGGWPARSKAVWESWRQDPATTVWGPGDLAAAVELIYVHAGWVELGPASLAAEIRMRSEALGLSPKGKQDRRLRVVVDEPMPAVSRRAGAKIPTRDYGHLHPVL